MEIESYNNSNRKNEQITNPIELIILFILPGAITTIAYFILINWKFTYSVTNIFLLSISAIVIMVPCQLGIIYCYNKKYCSKVNFIKLISYYNKFSNFNFIWIIPLLIAWSAFVIVNLKVMDQFIQNQFFSWIPHSFILSVNLNELTKNQLILLFLNSLFVTGILIPIVEEIYFRGFLMPRMEFLGIFAPILNALLFSLYHLWSPWQFLTRTIALIPVCYVVYKTKNIKFSIITHCLLNILGDAFGILIFIISKFYT